MSRRQMKKVLGPPQIDPGHSSSEEEEPHCSYVNKKPNAFAELEVQSPQSALEDCKTSESTASEDSETLGAAGCRKKETKKEKKNAKKKNKSKTNKSTSAMADDIDQLVQEVNDMLGEPSAKEETVTEEKPKRNIFSVRKMHLNVSNEINRLMGPDDADGNRRKQKEQSKDLIRNPITPLKAYPFKYMGLSMTIAAIRDGNTYFVYYHNTVYKERHKALVSHFELGNDANGAPIQESFANMHVEGMLELFRLYCQAEDYSIANSLLENLIGYLQFVAHPLFNITNVNCRLEYTLVENRAFHIAILLYCYMLSNKACHRTALELAKMLLNLDPSDPLGVIFIIDTFAIRAREYAWFIEAFDYWEIEKDVKYMFNLKYSYALAHFHVLNNKKEDLKLADKLLKEALVWFPMGLMAILSSTTLPSSSRTEKIRSHPLFTAQARTIFPLHDVIKLYAAMIGSRWVEPPVLEWLLRNADELIDIFETDPVVQTEVSVMAIWHRALYRRWPLPVARHLIIIYPMSALIADGIVSTDPSSFETYYFNPFPLEIEDEDLWMLLSA